MLLGMALVNMLVVDYIVIKLSKRVWTQYSSQKNKCCQRTQFRINSCRHPRALLMDVRMLAVPLRGSTYLAGRGFEAPIAFERP